MVSSQFFSANAKQSSPSTAPISFDSSRPADSSPWILDTLFRNLNYDLEHVADVIDPILTAQNHCYRTDWYIQGIVADERAFLGTNINPDRAIQLTLCGTRWLLGQSARCTVAMSQPGIAEYHAAIHFDSSQGFFITDLDGGGTWVNGRGLAPTQRHRLQDGDLVKLGSLRFEFLQQYCEHSKYEDD